MEQVLSKTLDFIVNHLSKRGYKSYVAAFLCYYYSLELVSYHVEKWACEHE